MDTKIIDMLVLDVDGVLTNGQLFYNEDGGESKAFHAHDGLGLKLLAGAGVKLAIITGRRSQVLSRRAQELGIEMVFQGVKDKKRVLDSLLAQLELSYAQVAYMGDDVNDLSCLNAVGLPMAPADACEPVLRVARFVSARPGGMGAVRQACEFILQGKGVWDDMVNKFFLA